jgi:hypothetical protein
MHGICINMSDDSNVSDEHMKWIMYYGARPLWKYLAEVMNIDISEVCAFVTKEDVFIETDGHKLIARTVQLPHANEVVSDVFNNDVCFLINAKKSGQEGGRVHPTEVRVQEG